MGKTYLIIGASSDIGIELMREINKIERDALIWAHFHSSDSEIKAIIPQNGNEIRTIQGDLSIMENGQKIAQKILDSKKIPNAVVHLPARKLEYQKFKDLSWDDCITDINIQTASIFVILQGLLPRIIKQEGCSKIVFMLSSNTIENPAKFTAKYTIAKYSLLGLMKALSSEYSGKNININALSPTMIDTKLLSLIDRRMLEVSGALDHVLVPKDIIGEILHLLSEASDGMSGQNIYVTGELKK